MKLLKRGIEIILVLSILCLILFEGSLPEHINEYANDKVSIKEHDPQGEYRSILTEENTIDLGNHIVAYLISGKAPGYLEGKWIVICDIEKENSFFIPNDFSEIVNISLSDSMRLHVEGRGGTDNYQGEIFVPLFFPGKINDCIEIQPFIGKTIVESRDKTEYLPKNIWEESFSIGLKKYKLTFEKISLSYIDLGSDVYGECADYQLVLKDEKNSIVYKQIFVGFPTEYENIYWLKDISNDGIPDVILCSFFYGYLVNNETSLCFLIWNSEKFVYEWKPLTLQSEVTVLGSPVWNQELSSIIFFGDGGQLSKYMYSFREGSWELAGQITLENGKIYEIYYEDGERIENEIIVSSGEREPWLDKSNVWCRDNIGNENLFPSY